MKLEKGTIYRHRYGGIYQLEGVAKSSEDPTVLRVVYSHVYPFDPDMWTRPFEEFTDGRFQEIDEAVLEATLAIDVDAYKKLIAANKAMAKK